MIDLFARNGLRSEFECSDSHRESNRITVVVGLVPRAVSNLTIAIDDSVVAWINAYSTPRLHRSMQLRTGRDPGLRTPVGLTPAPVGKRSLVVGRGQRTIECSELKSRRLSG